MLEFEKVHEDARGDIYVFTINEREFLVFFTRAGALRGGHFHDLNEYGVVLDGKIERRIQINNSEEIEVLSEGDTRVVPPKIPHLVKALTDSWVLEWHEYPKTRENYEPYRKLVEASINEKD